MEMFSFENSEGEWVPVGRCPNEETALALLGRQVGGRWSTSGTGDPEFWMMKTQSGWGRYSIPVYRAQRTKA
jgi:hypothetical protein